MIVRNRFFSLKRIALYGVLIICILVFAGCKSENRIRQQADQQGDNERIEQDITPPDAEPYRLLDDYNNRKFEILARMTERMDASDFAADRGYAQVFQDATFHVMGCASGLDKTLLCMTMLQVKAENDWQLQYDRYTGYMDMVDGLYKFEFYIAEEEEQETEEPDFQPETTPTESGYIPTQDPLATAGENTPPPTMIPERLAGYIEGTLPEGSNRMAINVYTGRIEDGTRALTLWFEITHDGQGGYFTQSYYAWDDVGVQFNTVREHVSAEGITYAVLASEERPASIFDTQPDDSTFFDGAASLMEFDGNKAVYSEDGDVVAEF